jgi:hypothetical protein
MKTNRRWLKSVIAAASSEEVVMPWAARRADKQGNIVALHTVQTAAQTTAQVQAAAAPRSYAIAAR